MTEDAVPEPSAEELKRASRLLSILERRDEEGALFYSDDDVLHFLPLVFLSVAHVGQEQRELPEAVVRLLGMFAEKAGIDVGKSRDEIAFAVERYYQDHPVNPELLLAFQAFVREELAAGSDKSRAFHAFLGEAPPSAQLAGQERPKGTVPGGILARLAKLDDDDKDDDGDVG